MENTNNTRTRRTPEQAEQIAKDVIKAVRKTPATIHEIGARAGLCEPEGKLDKSILPLVRKALSDSDKVVKTGKTRNTQYSKAA